MRKKLAIIFGTLILIALVLIAIYYSRAVTTKSDIEIKPLEEDNSIKVTFPQPNDIISTSHTLVITGKAKLNWFNTGIFRYRLFDANGNKLARNAAGRNGPCDENGFCPFDTDFLFDMPTTEEGTLVLYKPDDQAKDMYGLSIPVKFDMSIPPPDTGGDCIISGCDGYHCSYRKISNCEYNPESTTSKCYKKYMICERQENEKCGWTELEGFHGCIPDY